MELHGFLEKGKRLAERAESGALRQHRQAQRQPTSQRESQQPGSQGAIRHACSRGLGRDLEDQPKSLEAGSWRCLMNVASDGPTSSWGIPRGRAEP